MTVFSSPGVIRVQRDDEVWRLRLATPPSNILDAAKIEAITDVFEQVRTAGSVKAVCIEGEGPNFSFGASVEEHLPDRVGDMLRAFHAMFRTIAQSSVVTVAAVRGQCLGGGLELAAFCHHVIATPDAQLGQPEIRLGVFAPVGSLLLPERMHRAAAEALCLSGKSIDGRAAHAAGLVDELADDPGERATAWIRNSLGKLSASSVRFAARAVRTAFHTRLFEQLEHLERLYLDELMASADALEGLDAFLERRKPVWTHR